MVTNAFWDKAVESAISEVSFYPNTCFLLFLLFTIPYARPENDVYNESPVVFFYSSGFLRHTVVCRPKEVLLDTMVPTDRKVDSSSDDTFVFTSE